MPISVLENLILLTAIAVGSWQLIRDTVSSVLKKNFALDYVAILAILTGVFTGNYLVACVIVLMMAGGNTLEVFAQDRAKKSLTALSNRIPHHVEVIDSNKKQKTVSIDQVSIGSTVVVRKGEVVPLDGILLTTEGEFDESSLTGEPYPLSKEKGSTIPSGVVNVGQAVEIQTTVEDKNSTYRKIILLVEAAQNEKTPFLRLTDKMSVAFTVLTLLMAAGAYLYSGDISRVLAVLVIATPCPLILATPIALIGGMNAAASRKIIFKRLASLEILSNVKAMIFDKTGTLTFGTPELKSISLHSKEYSEKNIVAMIAGLKKNSLHPFAKAILGYAKEKHISPSAIKNIHEELGKGLTGSIDGKVVRLEKSKVESDKITFSIDGKVVAELLFSDEVKPAAEQVLKRLQKLGIQLHLFTGDSKTRAEELLKNLPSVISVKADCSPTEKRNGIEKIKQSGVLTAMVGDGLNDAPALALADVGIVFSHEEQTAASEAADVVLLDGSFESVLQSIELSRHTLFIAKQSIYAGLGLSLIGMVFAAAGYLPPIAGAVSQEIIDVAVILNALRAAFYVERVR